MTDQDKYYTPSPEEFHIGFEYEINDFGLPPEQCSHDKSKWHKQRIDNTSGIPFIWESSQNEMMGVLYRVKYLDKEDIESLGWNTHDDPVGYALIKNGKQYVIRPFVGSTLVQILCNWQQIFFGTVRNKSELKKILSMIGI